MAQHGATRWEQTASPSWRNGDMWEMVRAPSPSRVSTPVPSRGIMPMCLQSWNSGRIVKQGSSPVAQRLSSVYYYCALYSLLSTRDPITSSSSVVWCFLWKWGCQGLFLRTFSPCLLFMWHIILMHRVLILFVKVCILSTKVHQTWVLIRVVDSCQTRLLLPALCVCALW